MIYIFHYVWSLLEIMCLALLVLLQENVKLFEILWFFCLYTEILADSNLLRYRIIIKYSESQLGQSRFFIWDIIHSWSILVFKLNVCIIFFRRRKFVSILLKITPCYCFVLSKNIFCSCTSKITTLKVSRGNPERWIAIKGSILLEKI